MDKDNRPVRPGSPEEVQKEQNKDRPLHFLLIDLFLHLSRQDHRISLDVS